MESVASVFVHGPWAIFLVAGAHLLVWTASRSRAPSAAVPRAWLVAGIAWIAYGAWEAGVMIASPGANIRVDLLLIWPALLFLTGRALWKTLRASRPPTHGADPGGGI